jgi:WD40 repeat protein
LHKKSVFAVTVINDQIISAGRDASIFIQDLNTGEVIHKIPAHLSTINDFAINKDQSLLASASKDKSIRIWDTKTWQLLKTIDKKKYEYHSNSVNKIIWSADDKSLISISDDRLGIIWNIEKV